MRQLDPGLAIADLRVMNQVTDAAVSGQRFTLFLVGLFAVLALVLATIGIYGVISYSVNQRMHEFGLRMALGARPGDLVRMILRQGVTLSVAGAAIGLVCAAGLTRLLGSLLYGVGGRDPVTFAGVALLALVTTALACYVPARRAAEADPDELAALAHDRLRKEAAPAGVEVLPALRACSNWRGSPERRATRVPGRR